MLVILTVKNSIDKGVAKQRPNKAVTVAYVLSFVSRGLGKRDHWDFFTPDLINKVIFNQKMRETQKDKHRGGKYINTLNRGSRSLK